MSEHISELSRWEAVITHEVGNSNWLKVGEALAAIKHSGCYRDSHKTWEAYCEERWGWTRQRAFQYIQGYEASLRLVTSTTVDVSEQSPAGDAEDEIERDQGSKGGEVLHEETPSYEVPPIMPANERQARELRGVADPEEKRLALIDAKDRADREGGNLTSRHIREAAQDRRQPTQTPPQPPSRPPTHVKLPPLRARSQRMLNVDGVVLELFNRFELGEIREIVCQLIRGLARRSLVALDEELKFVGSLLVTAPVKKEPDHEKRQSPGGKSLSER